MSTTYDIICVNCREHLWIGQQNFIYLGDGEAMAMLQAFLFKHRALDYPSANPAQDHELRFVSEHSDYWEHESERPWTDFSKIKPE